MAQRGAGSATIRSKGEPDMADQQRLNSLERFRKRSGRLVLEQHSSCEVPAGCGGVVLRWRNPLTAIPITVHLYTPGKARLLLDGEPPQTSRVELAPGKHVAGLDLDGVELSAGLLLFVASYDPKQGNAAARTELSEPAVKVLSAGDGSWKYSLDPPHAWALPSFDDRHWPALVTVPTPTLDREARGAYQCRECAQRGAACLGLPAPAPEGTGQIWIRKVFDVPAPRPGAAP
jgi:hypothetical protein